MATFGWALIACVLSLGPAETVILGSFTAYAIWLYVKLKRESASPPELAGCLLVVIILLALTLANVVFFVWLTLQAGPPK